MMMSSMRCWKPKSRTDRERLPRKKAFITPAGTFNCTKWEYTYEVYTKMETEIVPLEETTEVYNVSLWTAPGVGVVKTIEKSDESTSTTELQKID